MNIILKPFNICPECFSEHLTTDLRRIETYCSECGLVVANEELPTITALIKEEEHKQKLINGLINANAEESFIELIKNSN